MMRRLIGLIRPAQGLFAAVEGNARVLIITEGLSAIAFHLEESG
jgi:hypothetical protein